jgi:hypothetical protein
MVCYLWQIANVIAICNIYFKVQRLISTLDCLCDLQMDVAYKNKTDLLILWISIIP